ncbi:MAG: transketolase [Lachnospiraceae bacterium]|nr:transketolase [Lachnospiraceae bacterium]
MSDIKMLESKAKEMRRNIVTMLGKSQSGHPGGSLSCADLVTALYFDVMNVDPKNPQWEDRDRFVLSKGHACPTLYAALAMKGYFPMEVLDTLREFGSPLQGHPASHKCPGVDVSTGSLGQGISVANGIALGAKLNNKDYTTYCLLGDGEIEEGQVWEAAMFAAHYKLDNLMAFVDYNHLQIDGTVEDVAGNVDLAAKWEAFGWNVLTCDGHDIEAILAAIKCAKSVKGKPSVIIMNTVKGKGVSFMENQVGWHGKAPSEEQVAQALKELGE